MTDMKNAKIAILSTNGFEQSELFEPKRQLEEAGATVIVISPESGSIKGWDKDDWGESIDVDLSLDDARVEDFDALVLPGGQISTSCGQTRRPLPCATLNTARRWQRSATRPGCWSRRVWSRGAT